MISGLGNLGDSPASRCVLPLGSAALNSSFLGIDFYLLDLGSLSSFLANKCFSETRGGCLGPARRWIRGMEGSVVETNTEFLF